MMNIEDELEYLRGQIAGLTFNMANALARFQGEKPPETRCLDELDKDLLRRKPTNTEHWRRGFQSSIGEVEGLLDRIAIETTDDTTDTTYDSTKHNQFPTAP